MSALSSLELVLKQSLGRTFSTSRCSCSSAGRTTGVLKLRVPSGGSGKTGLLNVSVRGLRLQPLQLQSLTDSKRDGIIDIVEASISTTKYSKAEESKFDKGNNRGERRRENFVITLLVLSIVYGVWTNWDKLKRKATECFKVQAAKPLNNTDESYARLGSQGNSTFGFGGGSGDDGKPKSRRLANNEIADVVEMVGNAVVCIEIKDHSMLDWMSGSPRTVSNGSGFIIKDDGLIITNAHVVMGGQRASLTVRLHDGRCFNGIVEDVDTQSDIATIRINARGLPVMPLGSSSSTRIGEKVVAIGSPLSLSNSVTSGVVSCVSRKADELGIGTNINYIQTDASITFGNSGGPLVNLDGEAIGINSMKVTAGISFAIPIDYAKEFLARAEANAKAGPKRTRTKRYIGFTLLTLNEDIVGELPDFGWAKNIKGVLIWKIVVGSPAYLAGLQPGDIITKVNGEPVSTAGDIYKMLHTVDTLTIQFRRYDKTYKVQLTPENVSQ